MQRVLGFITAALATVLFPVMMAWAEDIDIFTGTTETNPNLPNVIFILDNSANWSRQSQKWPGGLVQGQSEVRALKTTLSAQTGKLNVGIIEYSTQGNSADNEGGYVRFDLQALTDESLVTLNGKLDAIYDGINSPEEKRSQSGAFGYLPYDLYNYLKGIEQSKGGAGTPAGLADVEAYSSQFNVFSSPLDAGDACVDTYLIFIGNNSQSGPRGDDAANSAALKTLYEAAGAEIPDAFAGDSGQPLEMPGFRVTNETEPGENIGVTTACYTESQQGQCTADVNEAGGLCDGVENCSCTSRTSNKCGGGGKEKPYTWNVGTADFVSTTVEADGTVNTTGGLSYNLDDWAKFLHNYGVPLSFTTDDGESVTQRIGVTTYTIDVYNKQSNAEFSGLLFSAANAGGGRYFVAKSEDQIVDAINTALGDIISVNTSFAAVTLPLNTANRASVENQVYIGMFRPSKGKEPRWFGNLKRYQLGIYNGESLLADVNFSPAINPVSGYAAPCAASFWTTDSGAYWEDLGIDPPPLGADCVDNDPSNDWSDLPDGPFVEKGGAAQQVREIANADADTRPIYTVKDGALAQLAASDGTAMGGAEVLSYLRGSTPGAGEVMPDAGLRASIHGDVVHSRPLSISYGNGLFRLFYGANDGLYREVDGSTGAELWALVPPEHFSRLERLRDNAPLVKYTGNDEDVAPEYLPKDYFFDGSTGEFTQYSQADGSLEAAYIYPTMRRGGRMIYALDVTDPATIPELMWRVGCPEIGSDAGCVNGFEDMGQTWSTPISGFAGGYIDDGPDQEPRPIIMFGGGFDDCLNADQATYPCLLPSVKGKGVYVLDAQDGTVVRTFATDAPVITSLSSVDMDYDGVMDFAYVADVAGSIYRISLGVITAVTPNLTIQPMAVEDWEIDKVGYTAGADRRFYNSPVAASFQGLVFVTIGSGDRERPLETNYPYVSDVQNRFYALIDRPSEVDPMPVNMDGATMLEVTDEEPEVLPGDEPVEDAGNLSDYDGWYMDLPDRGEQVANPAAIAGGQVFFNTLQPGGGSNGLCSRPLGVGTAYTVSLFNPEYTEGVEQKTDGFPIQPVIANVEVPHVECEGNSCEADDCNEADANCETKTLCLGCVGPFDPLEIIPTAPPIRKRIFWTEDIDR